MGERASGQIDCESCLLGSESERYNVFGYLTVFVKHVKPVSKINKH